MKIAIIGSRGYPYVYSGYETFVKELSERLVKKNVQVTIYCHKNLFSVYPEYVNGIKLVYIPTIETKSLSQLVHSFFSFIHAVLHRPDVILTVNAANGPFGLITKLFRIPSLINVDGLEWLRPKWKGLGAAYFHFSAKLATQLYDKVITDADAMRTIYLKEFGKDSTVIAYGANIRYPKNPAVLEQLSLEPFSYYLIVGRLIPDNNADLLVKGFQQSGSSKKLVIVGDVPYKDTFAEVIKSNAGPDILFTGYIIDSELLSELYHHCFAYLHGHEFGGTNPTMLKALAYGTAILALDTVFNREMLQNGSFGMFFEKNEASVAAIMQSAEADTNKIEQMRNNSRNGLTEKYSWDNITETYLSVFNSLVQ